MTTINLELAGRPEAELPDGDRLPEAKRAGGGSSFDHLTVAYEGRVRVDPGKVVLEDHRLTLPAARLDWFYRRTPYFDERDRLHPIARSAFTEPFSSSADRWRAAGTRSMALSGRDTCGGQLKEAEAFRAKSQLVAAALIVKMITPTKIRK